MKESADHRAIRVLVEEWMAATKRGDHKAVLELMTDDVVFLVPGQEPMDKAAFESAVMSRPDTPAKFEGVSDIKEIHVEGNTAYMWSHLSIRITSPGDSAPVRRAGHTLTIFKKVDDRWLLSRDANLLVKT